MKKAKRAEHSRASTQSSGARSSRGIGPQDDSPALPRTSRFRAHDHEGDQVRGCLGASARYENSSTDPAEDTGWIA